MDDISPELAAQIVKNYILPMFESDNKKHLRKKYSRLTTKNEGKSSKGKNTIDTI